MPRPKAVQLTRFCKTCQTPFQISSINKEDVSKRAYCSKSCQSKAIQGTDIRKLGICVVCQKEFLHYGERITCDRKCNDIYASRSRVGINNPAYLENSESVKYDKAYPHVFKKIRLLIKDRDNHICVLCGDTKNLQVHHIDYDKNNNELINLVTLCQRCHMLTNFNRTYWEIIFAALLSGSKIVQKGWGFEVHITNNSLYCLKYLVFFESKEFSFHYHTTKKELWHCLIGKFECTLQKDDENIVNLIFQKGDKLEIEPSIKHQLRAVKNSIIIEVSTEDFPEDSY